ncbi:MAG: hypothetical protein AB1806_18325 [Acidobacteriota bacterium]
MTLSEKCRALERLLASMPPASVLQKPPSNSAADLDTLGGRAPFPMDLMLARLGGFTEILSDTRDVGTPIDAAIEQMLLADLGLVAAYLRCQADDLSARLNAAISELREAQSELADALLATLATPPEAAGGSGHTAGKPDTLTALGVKHRTDKALHHKFTEDYNTVLEPVRFEVTSLLEIGVCKGRSVRMWLDYFPNATITCIDNRDVGAFLEGLDRVEFLQCAQSDYRTDRVFDIIVDDASHRVKDQQDTFSNLLGNWRRCYIIEDLQTSGDPEYGYDGTNSTIAFLQDFQRRNESTFHVKIITKDSGSITSIVTRR